MNPSSQSSSDTGASAHDLGVGGSVWLQSGQQMLGGATRIALLAAIGETGSITGAAKAVGMSYKGAWDAIDAMNNLAGVPLVERAAGGKGGGGTTLTPRALRLIDTWRAIEREHRRFLERAAAASGLGGADSTQAFDSDWALLSRFSLRTSARNQLYGTVAAIEYGEVNDEVSMTLPGGQTVVAVVTRESTEALGLAVGAAAVALVKASSVVLVAGEEAATRLSARNRLAGAVGHVRRGAVNAEVTLDLPGGTVIAAVVTDASVDALGLVAGVAATAVFKASSVILGVSG
ncbi:TOBE domain-containing protein [Paraburkholderia dinghuensis]|uniref:LysR family transcriptional regulator n=1 Tax=Paraburkholderia dinghuensis TaxID=2305225 RepID=A0A3N6MPW0_9BURK|nr:TOBE domain-containing protein [Paraburkholderia dinghuensis]RQH05698.1 LysR family transcriptional regulator [Paraburkholderia dinghuensis]